MDRTVNYGRIKNVVVLIFPDEEGSKHFITKIETENLLRKIGVENTPVKAIDPKWKPRLVA